MVTNDSTGQNNNNQPTNFELEYFQPLWGDLIYGTKDQLQSIGIAIGMPFPAESGGPKRSMSVIDPRGFATKVQESFYRGDGVYSASISFPNREKQKDQWTDFSPGVRKCSSCHWFDEYIGTAEALVASGLVRKDQFPGMPGMRKVCVSILPDGTLATLNCSKAKEPGAKWIKKQSKGTYRLCVQIQKDESARREEKNKREEMEYENRMKGLPRPAPLIMFHRTKRESLENSTPMYHVDGNVIHILSMARGREAYHA